MALCGTIVSRGKEDGSMDVKEVCIRLGRSESTIKRWLRSGYLKGTKLGRDWHVKESEIQRHLDGKISRRQRRLYYKK